MYKQESWSPEDCTDILPDNVDFTELIRGIITPSREFPDMASYAQDETLDVAATEQPVQFFPITLRGPPERTVFEGQLNFQVEINALDTHKKKYLYSNRLNRIYVDMKQNFSVQYTWNSSLAPRPMFVRTVVVFSEESQAEKRVERCTQHTHESVNNGINEAIVKNVLHSSREAGALGVYYCGAPAQPDSWFSVLVEFPTPGPHSHAYHFVCKSSCSTGINRRPIEIIFTLEDASGHVYGRQTVGARVCSCLRRDMRRDEAEGVPSKKRRLPKPACPALNSLKKIKLVTVDTDDTLITLPPIQIVGTKIVRTGLEMMLSMMEQAANHRRNDPNCPDYSRSIAALKAEIEDLKPNKPPTQ